MHRGRRTYRPPHPVVPWVLAIARYVFMTDWRVRKRRGRTEAPYPDSPPVQFEAGRPFEAEVVARDELQDTLACLTPAMRDAVLMHHVSGLDFDGIGRRNGITPATARVRSSRGMALLRRALAALRHGTPAGEKQAAVEDERRR